jgi:hypothetical protein
VDLERSAILKRYGTWAKAILWAAALGVAATAGAVKTSTWSVGDVNEFFAGEEAIGITIDHEGNLSLGAAWDSLATGIEGASYAWSIARDSKGRVYLGTGDEGRLYRWTPGGALTLMWDTDAAEITSLVVDPADNVYAGSSPGGVIFRVTAKGDTSRYYDTEQPAVWAIIGGIFGGAKGAAIGGSVGAGAGTTAVLAGGRNAATLPSGTPVTVRLTEPVIITIDRQ